MPIAPSFTLSQTDTHVILEIAVPHVRVHGETLQVVLTDDNTVVHFASPPIYLLLLNFAPYQFQNDEDQVDESSSPACKATFLPTVNNGTVRVELEKLQAGVHWDNLDLIGKLKLKPASNQNKTSRWLQEIIVDNTELDARRSDDADDSAQSAATAAEYGLYGFARLFSGVFTDLVRDGLAKEMLEMPWTADDDRQAAALWQVQGCCDADNDITVRSSSSSSIQLQRRKQRMQLENEKFCKERYLGDLHGVQDDYIYECALAMEAHWMLPKPSHDTGSGFFSEPERTLLMSIPYPLLPHLILSDDDQNVNKNERLAVGMLDLLFAYVYDHLITDGDPTVESAWTVSTLSASLCWLDDWIDDDDGTATDLDAAVKSVVQSSIRRALVYPYIRTVDFGVHVWKQVALVLRQGLRTVIRCLLQLRVILDRSEMYYLGNKLFVDPYLAWLQQHAHPESLEANSFLPLADAIDAMLLDGNTLEGGDTLKDNLGFDLKKLEAEMLEDDGDESSSDTTSEDENDSGKESEDDCSSSASSKRYASDALEEEPATVNPVETLSISEADDLSKELLDLQLGGTRSPLDLFCLSEGKPTADKCDTEMQKCGNKPPLIQEVE
jgi:protein SHQ1